MSDQESDERGSSSESEQESNSDSNVFIYRDSSSEAEEWDEDIHWAVRDVNGEYHPPRGPRYLKFDWDQWRRVDDTSHTWEREGSIATQDARRTIRQFDLKHTREESANAKDVRVHPYTAISIPSSDDENNGDSEHVNNQNTTAHKSKKRRLAYLFTEIPQQAITLFVDAKLKQINRRPSGYSEALTKAEDRLTRQRQSRQDQFEESRIDSHIAFYDKLLGFGRADLPSEASRIRVKTQKNMQERMSNLKIKETSLPSQKNIPPPPAVVVASPSISSSKASTSTRVDSPIMSFQSTVTLPHRSIPSLRNELERRWSKIARRAGAAPITFANDYRADSDDIPPIDIETFQYLENTYLYAEGVPRPDPNFFHSCDCPAGSCKPETCSCQEDSMISDDDGNKRFMYDSKGLYMFDLNVESYVVECNEKCSCGPSCQSRVAQKPRKIPIEIFLTARCGWGVRSSVDIPKGTVLGLYTGTLLDREIAQNMPVDDSRYLCDLDFHKSVMGNEKGCTVDARTSGNWTRFVNHSCDPLCKLFAVIYDSVPHDSVPESHQPKLALVAQKPILAMTEITLDYYPNYNKKGKGKQKVTERSLECRCGTENCRGYVY